MKNRKYITAAVAVLGIITLGLLADQVGYVSVRRVQLGTPFSVEVSEPLVPGLKTTVRWELGETQSDQMIEIELKTEGFTGVIAEAPLSASSAVALIPCNIGSLEGTLTIAAIETGEIITWRPVELLLPGQDCLPR